MISTYWKGREYADRGEPVGIGNQQVADGRDQPQDAEQQPFVPGRPGHIENCDFAGIAVTQRQAHHQAAKDAGEKLQADRIFVTHQFARQQNVERKAKGRGHRVERGKADLGKGRADDDQRPGKAETDRRNTAPVNASPKNRADSRVTSRGSMKKIAMASAMGSTASPEKKNSVAKAIIAPRAACSHSAGVSQGPRVLISRGDMKIIWKKKRLQVTCPDEIEPASHLAMASMPGKRKHGDDHHQHGPGGCVVVRHRMAGLLSRGAQSSRKG